VALGGSLFCMQSAKGVAPRTMTSPLAKTSRVCCLFALEHRPSTPHSTNPSIQHSARIEKQVKKSAQHASLEALYPYAPAMTPVWLLRIRSRNNKKHASVRPESCETPIKHSA